MKNNMFAILPQGEVNRSEVLRIINQFGYSAFDDNDFISRIGFNTIYFVGDKWTNWTNERAIEQGFTIINGDEFLDCPEDYIKQLT